jgi:hypothetical protein
MHPGSRHGELLAHARSTYPLPVAEAVRKWQFAGDGNRLNEALFLSKALIVTLATVSIAWCRSVFSEPPGVLEWYESFKRRNPTLGQWTRAARDGARLARKNGVVLFGFEQALGAEDSRLGANLDALVRWRNRYGGGGGSGLRGASILTEVEGFEELLLDTLEHCRFLDSMRFALLESSELQRKSRQFLIRYRRVAGDNPVLEPGVPFEYPEPFISGSLYLLLAPGRDIDLTPLWTIQPCKHCRHPELCYLVRAKLEALEYSSFSNNHTVTDRKLAGEIEWVEGSLATSGRFRELPPLITLVQPEQLRTHHNLPAGRINLPHLHRQTQSSVLKAMRVDTKKGHTGWNHRLDLPRVTVGGTSMGLQVMRIVSDDFGPFKADDVIETLWKLRLEDGGWAYSTQAPVSRPEATADVLLTLSLFGEWERIALVVKKFKEVLERSSDEVLWRRVFSLATSVPALATVAPHAQLLGELVEALWNAGRYDQRDGQLYWTRLTRFDPGYETTVPSAAHTAKAALALLHCFRATDGKVGASPEDLQPAANWLLRHRDWSNTDEIIHRPFGQSRDEELPVRYFTTAWAVRALLELDVDPSNERVASAIAEIYNNHTNGLWSWGDFQHPAWATLDALRALETYSMRASPLEAIPEATLAAPHRP